MGTVPQPKGDSYLVYDAACGFCRRWVPFWEGTLRKRGLKIAPLQSEWVRQALGEEELLSDLRILFPNGRQIRGADVYRYAMRRIWWAYPFWVLSSLPVLRRVFDWSYRTFAVNRHRFSQACGLPSD